VQTDESAEQRGLSGPIASHDGDDFSGLRANGDTAQGDGVAMSDNRIGHRKGLATKNSRHLSSLIDERLELFAKWGGATTGVAHGKRERVPTREASEFDDGRCDGCVDHDLVGSSDPNRFTRATNNDHSVCVLDDAFEPVLSHQNRDAKIVDKSLESSKNLLRSTWIQR
jgi:hypothetical protein